MLLVARTYTGNAYQQEGGDLAVHKVAVVVYHPPLDASVQVAEYAAPVVEHGRVDGVLEELHQNGDINYRAEYLVEPL